MKTPARIFALCSMLYALAHAPVCAQNLTSFNDGGGAMNNAQWNATTNPRSAPGAPAAANFGNCDALIQRCAAPKCAGGRCSDMQVAVGIVNGCVMANETCKSYGDALVQSIAAQMVANSTVVARADAGNTANDAAAQQIELMRQELMRSQQETDRRMEAALTEQQEASRRMEAALAEQKQQAAAPAPTATISDSAVQIAAASGISADILVRQQAMGMIESKLDDVRSAMARVNASMDATFQYAGCGPRGDDCTGPRRAARFRQLANNFFDPYEEVLDSIYDALIMAQTLGVDITDIYMMLNGSCHVWGQFLCTPGQHIRYASCGANVWNNSLTPDSNNCNGCGTGNNPPCPPNQAQNGKVLPQNLGGCQLMKMLTDNQTVQQNWIYPEQQSNRKPCATPDKNGTEGCFCTETRNQDGSVTLTNCYTTTGGSNIQVACASEALDSGFLGARRRKQSNIDIGVLQMMVMQDAPAPTPTGSTTRNQVSVQEAMNFCNAQGFVDALQRMKETRLVPTKMCVRRDSVKEGNIPGILGVAGDSTGGSNLLDNSASARVIESIKNDPNLTPTQKETYLNNMNFGYTPQTNGIQKAWNEFLNKKE
ncbi:MAG: hypothetical protein FWG39_00015 [Alphaproteobacteria bacterium]|nr:hypothetical protein [Alphaproteobacteria bacterium]